MPCKATALAYFPDVTTACDAIPYLNEAGCAAVELMDHASLASIHIWKPRNQRYFVPRRQLLRREGIYQK